MPTPNKQEKKKDYISRCVHYVVHNEGLKPEAAVGKCYGLWNYFKKKQRSKGSLEEPNFEENIKELNIQKDGFNCEIKIN